MPRTGEVGRKWGVTVNGHGDSFWGDETVPKLIVVMVAQFCDYTQNIELYTLNGRTVWHVNYLSIKLLKN